MVNRLDQAVNHFVAQLLANFCFIEHFGLYLEGLRSNSENLFIWWLSEFLDDNMNCKELTMVLVIPSILHNADTSICAASMLCSDDRCGWIWIISLCGEDEFVFTCALLFVS